MLGRQAGEGSGDQVDVSCGTLRNIEFGFPGRHVAGGIDIGAQINQGRRSLRIPAMLIGP